MTELTQEQLAAVLTPDPSVVVRAAAGAGKTRVLVERYLKHVLEDHASPDEILAVTFTRKAAAEMKRRIVQRLEGLGLTDLAQLAETGPIQTIHGYCERLLRECCVDAGLDPEFEVLDEGVTAYLIHQSVLSAIANAAEDSHADTVVATLAGKALFGGASPHARLVDLVTQTVLALRGSGHERSDLQELHSDPEELIGAWRAAWVESLDPALRAAFAHEDPALPFENRLYRAFKSLKRAAIRGLGGREPIEEMNARTLRAAQMSCGLVQLACDAWRSFEDLLAERNALDFVLLEERAVHLVRDHPAVRRRLRNRFRFALVDEAQDLSPLQYRILEALGVQTEAFVGDAQQSIYGFRQAELRLFLQKAERSRVQVLSQNFRSTDGILAFVDRLFGQVWGESYVPMLRPSGGASLDAAPPSFDGVEVWMSHVMDLASTAHWIDELLQSGEKASDVAVLVRRGQVASDLLARLEALGIRGRLVGGTERFYTRLEVRDLANALRAIEHPHDDFALLATLRSPVVGLSLDSIAMLALQKPVIDALPSFTAPTAEDADRILEFLGWFGGIQGRGDRLTAAEAMALVLAKSPFLKNVAARQKPDQAIANARKLLRMACGRPELSPSQFAEHVREVQELRHREGDASAVDDRAEAVTLMTIHKAKGLEFPIVVLPDMFGRIVRSVGDVEIDKDHGFVSAGFDGAKAVYHHWISEIRKERERAEAMRLLYVAMTRAQRRLCIVAHPNAASGTLAHRVSELIGLTEGVPAGVLVRKLPTPNAPSAPGGHEDFEPL